MRIRSDDDVLMLFIPREELSARDVRKRYEETYQEILSIGVSYAILNRLVNNNLLSTRSGYGEDRMVTFFFLTKPGREKQTELRKADDGSLELGTLCPA